MTRGAHSDLFDLDRMNVHSSISYVSPAFTEDNQLDVGPLDANNRAERISAYGTFSDRGRHELAPDTHGSGRHPDTHAHGAGDA